MRLRKCKVSRMIPKQKTLVQIKCVWIAPHGRFQAMLTRYPCLPHREAIEARPGTHCGKRLILNARPMSP